MAVFLQQALLFFTLAVAVQADWILTWSDEFDGKAGTSPDGSKWNFDIGGGSDGWGNKELEYYTSSTNNAAVNGEGHLLITARKDDAAQYKCWYGTCQYTSARMTTKNRFSQTYGKIEARIKISWGKGAWPAFWMLGTDIDTNTWPNCGEIDIMEVRGSDPAALLGTIHGPGYSGGGGIGTTYRNPTGKWLSEEFHVYTIEWAQNSIKWYLDGQIFQTRTPADLNGKTWVFNHDFFILLNFAVGGNFDGDPGSGTPFPQTMAVDYVRVYRQG